MPIVLRLQSFVEAQLDGIGPPELVSFLAEFFVAACLFGPVIAIAMIASWLVRKGDAYRASQLHHRSTR
jgi:hypothetical protein